MGAALIGLKIGTRRTTLTRNWVLAIVLVLGNWAPPLWAQDGRLATLLELYHSSSEEKTQMLYRPFLQKMGAYLGQKAADHHSPASLLAERVAAFQNQTALSNGDILALAYDYQKWVASQLSCAQGPGESILGAPKGAYDTYVADLKALDAIAPGTFFFYPALQETPTDPLETFSMEGITLANLGLVFPLMMANTCVALHHFPGVLVSPLSVMVHDLLHFGTTIHNHSADLFPQLSTRDAPETPLLMGFLNVVGKSQQSHAAMEWLKSLVAQFPPTAVARQKRLQFGKELYTHMKQWAAGFGPGTTAQAAWDLGQAFVFMVYHEFEKATPSRKGLGAYLRREWKHLPRFYEKMWFVLQDTGRPWAQAQPLVDPLLRSLLQFADGDPTP